jgi:hypothetical protein
MALLDWTFVVFGLAVALVGSWIQLHPERIYPRRAEGWPLDPAALAQIRILGACFLFMGTFFAAQMTIDLARLPWWTGTLCGLVAASTAMTLIKTRVQRQLRHRRLFIQQSPLAEKTLELR